jgi:hypothetical protein
MRCATFVLISLFLCPSHNVTTFQQCSFWNIDNRPRYNNPLPTYLPTYPSNSSNIVCVYIATGTCLLSCFLAMTGEIHTQTHMRSRLTAEELLESMFSLWHGLKLYKEDNSLLRAMGYQWCEDSQGCQAVKYGHESHGTWNKESLCWQRPAAF